jgi:hypothetical protein
LTPPTNPTVTLDDHAIEVDAQYFEGGIAQELFIESRLDDLNCQSIPDVTGLPIYTVVGEYKGSFWLHDPRFSIFENSIESPKADGGGAIVESTMNATDDLLQVRCFSAPMNFLNEDSCFLSTEPHACGEVVIDTGATVSLTFTNFEKVYEASNRNRYIYAVTGLRQSKTDVPYDPPCTPSTTSRWIPVDDCSTNTLDNMTAQVFSDLIGSSTDTSNPYMRDVFFPALGVACHPSNAQEYNFKVLVDGQCWENVHQSFYQVYDFTKWVGIHPGGPSAIQQFAALSGNFTLAFPWWHPMSRWHGNVESELVELGRLGDEMSVDASPVLADAFADIIVDPQIAGSTVVCGSPHEVANNADNYGSLYRGAFDAATFNNRTTGIPDLEKQRTSIWMEIALKGDDQLRQKVAWALSQILVVSPGAINAYYATENFLVSYCHTILTLRRASMSLLTTVSYSTFVKTYYDIFVRNAFGSYRNILKEVSYSPLMAEMLSYLNSESTAFIWQRRKRLEYADENYAREVMQLFSIGLYMLNNDGTHVLDQDGNPISTYSNGDITEYARLWTGFQRQSKRGNIEEYSKCK